MKLNIAILPGDGIGPEIVEQAMKSVKAIAQKFNHKLEYQYGLTGAAAIDQVGDPYPAETHDLCMKSDAVLFGAIGDPKFDNNPKAPVRPEQGLLAMRKKLGLYANIRPVETFESLLHKSPLRRELVEGADFVCIRELTGGMYFGEKGRKDNGNTAFDTCIYTREEVERILKLGYEFAAKRNKKLTVVDKANVLESSRLWREVAQEMAPNYPDIKTEYMFVDNAAMQIIQWPKNFDVMVTENMFGDILTDEASVITGSLGLLPSASVGIHTSVFEPIHGSYPQAAGKDIANPIATILSAAMMFEYAFNLKEEGKLIRDAVAASMKEGFVTEDIAGGPAYKTSQVGDWIAHWIEKN
ncbi:3-isopropylmalate dehydrogenase [Maribellus sp. CM-23]|uniref:3-isopropylmalate dehydrogenase n=1 Tax=Maribellus sp. CM-23 TaxID=2781026 RepID=UPI001F29D4BF|nr:3-isopropylmalate dehydrogenase [Maribellus sp. CM-23]MCE4566395.1 3-isopropylmalate dehydrogenase [Maribellus sp. CM-23]